MTMHQKHSTLRGSELEAAAAAAVERAVQARQQAGIELSSEQLNSVSGGAAFYFKDPFIYGIKVDPLWFRNFDAVALNPQPLPPKSIGG